MVLTAQKQHKGPIFVAAVAPLHISCADCSICNLTDQMKPYEL